MALDDWGEEVNSVLVLSIADAPSGLQPVVPVIYVDDTVGETVLPKYDGVLETVQEGLRSAGIHVTDRR